MQGQMQIILYKSNGSNYHMERNLYRINKSIESVGFEETLTNFIEIFVPQEQFLNILVAIADGSDVCCFNLNLINIFTKSTNAGICTDITFKLTLNCLFVTVEDLNL